MALTQQQIDQLKTKYTGAEQTTEQTQETPDAWLARIKGTTAQPKEKSFLSKAGTFIKEATTGSTRKFGKTIGESIVAPEAADMYAKALEQHTQSANLYKTKINELKKEGKDTSRYEKLLSDYEVQKPKLEDFTGDVINKTTGQVLGEALGTGVEALQFGMLSKAGSIAKTAAEAKKAKETYNALSLSQKAKQIGKDTLSLAKTTIPFGYAIDVSQGLQGARGEDRTGVSALIPGAGTLVSAAIPVVAGTARLAKASAAEFLPKVSSNIGGTPEAVYNQAKKGTVSQYIGKENPATVFEEARNKTLQLSKQRSKEFGQSIEDLATQFKGSRIGLQQSEIKKLNQVAERFGFQDRLPQNMQNMSPKETINLLKEINAINPITSVDDPLVKNFKLSLSDIKKSIVEKATKNFGGKGGTFEQMNVKYSKSSNILKDIQSIVGNVHKKLTPVQMTTAKNRLMKIFENDRESYLEAIKALDDTMGSKLIDKIAAANLSPILPKGLKGGPTGIVGLASDILQLATLPVSSPRMSNWLLSKVSGYGPSVIQNILNSSPVTRQSIYKLVNEKNMSLDEAISETWNKIQNTSSKVNPQSGKISSKTAIAGGLGLAALPAAKELGTMIGRNSVEQPKEVKEVPLTPSVSVKKGSQTVKFEEIKNDIAHRETGIVQGNKYSFSRTNKNGSEDLGKYQVNTDTLKTYSKKFLGKEVSKEEFLSDPNLQEKFFAKAIMHLVKLGVKNYDTLLALWHKGWGDISSKRIKELLKDEGVQMYLNNK